MTCAISSAVRSHDATETAQLPRQYELPKTIEEDPADETEKDRSRLRHRHHGDIQ